jgi:F-type H+-transporting ATPase subunit b
MKSKRQSTKLWAAVTAGLCLASPMTVLAAAEPEQPNLLGFDPASSLWVLFMFIILVVILYKTAWKNVLAGLNAREKRIRSDIADAEAAHRKGAESLKEYNAKLATAESQVRELLNTAALEAEKISSGIKTRAQQEVEEIRERAAKEIEASRKQAISEVYEQTAQLATMIAEKILKRSLNADDQRDLVNQSLEQLQSVQPTA